jgi:3-methyladenine DNA glycosylase AlkD
MMTAAQVLKQLEPLAGASYKKVLLKHGIKEPVLGVNIEELKKIQKQVRKDHELALALFDTGIYDAQYLAGLIADESKMTKKDLRRWLKTSNCAALCGTIVAQVAAEGAHGRELALDWIESSHEDTAQAGWQTLSSVVAITDDAALDVPELERLVERVEKTIHLQPNLVRYAMNGFVIAVGSYIRDLTDRAIRAGESIGRVSVDMGETACKVPSAPDYIRKVQKRGSIGKKRKSARC